MEINEMTLRGNKTSWKKSETVKEAKKDSIKSMNEQLDTIERKIQREKTDPWEIDFELGRIEKTAMLLGAYGVMTRIIKMKRKLKD
jgi:hypothetical protein